ncbi:MAG: hypothetical protein HFE51_05115 [Clostridia bacterium]|nr:hypothetical protein [Clostridia bacterium]
MFLDCGMNELSFIDWINILDFIIGLKNYEENEKQSSQTIELIRQNNVDRANNKQADLLLSVLSAQFEKQNEMLKEIQNSLNTILERLDNNA